MTEHITWAGRTFSGTDRFGLWTANVPEGLWDSPDTKGQSVDRENADGEYDLPTYNAARLATFTGSLRARSHAELHEAGNYLKAAMRGRLQVAGHGPTQWADAKRDGKIRFTPITDTYAQWQVPLKCPNPALYGDLQSYALAPNTAVNVFHRGSYDAAPVVQLNGPFTGGFTITHPGGLYTALGDVATGGVVRVEFATGRLRLNGNDRTDLVTRADLFKVYAGRNASVKTSRGSGHVEVLDTYM